MKVCYVENKLNRKKCRKKECKYWNKKCESNCVISESANGSKTLQEIGDIFGVTRMRICQVEKKILTKLERILNKEII